MSGIRLIITGCGGSAGTPAIGNHWGKCDPSEPRNQRSRAAAALLSETTSLLIDTGPEFREQVNRTGLTKIDAVLFTHAHGDHIHGIDDLRSYRNRSKALVDIWGNAATIAELEDRFAYLFTERQQGLYPQVVRPHIYEFNRPTTIGDIAFIPFEQDHGTCETVGFRIGDTAYSTDLIRLPQASIELLAGIKTWVVDAAGYKMPQNWVHMTLKDLYALNKVVQAEKIYLTHLTPAMDYRTLLNELPDGYEPAYDGLEIEIS